MNIQRQKKSEIWNFFTDSDTVKKICTCNLCKKTISYKSSVSNLKSHMKFKHPTINIQQAQQQSACPLSESECSVSSQQTVPITENAPSTSSSSGTNDEFLPPPAKQRKIQSSV